MYCTGGIRCEKVHRLPQAEGVEQVYHLKGGILKYLEEVPEDESLWEGECFVFDQRVTVAPRARPRHLRLCRACRRPILKPTGLAHLFCERGELPRLPSTERSARTARRLCRAPAAGSARRRRGGNCTWVRCVPAEGMTSADPLYLPPLPLCDARAPGAVGSGDHGGIARGEARRQAAATDRGSPKATVPVLVWPDGAVIDESLAIMRWALAGTIRKAGWRAMMRR